MNNVRFLPEDVRVEGPDVREAEVLGLFGQFDDPARRRVRLERDAEVHAFLLSSLVPPLAELGTPAIRVKLYQEDAVKLDCGIRSQPSEPTVPASDASVFGSREDLVGELDPFLVTRRIRPVVSDAISAPCGCFEW